MCKNGEMQTASKNFHTGMLYFPGPNVLYYPYLGRILPFCRKTGGAVHV